MESDLLAIGWRLSDVGSRYSWRDLLVMVRRFQQDPASATSKDIHGEHWKITDQLLAVIVDLLQVGNWQRARKKSAPKPKRLPRPWERPKGRQLGSKPIPISAFDGWWEGKRKKRR